MVALSTLLPLVASALSTLARSNPISSSCKTAGESPGWAPNGSADLGEDETTKQSASAAAEPPPAIACRCVQARAVRSNSARFSMYLQMRVGFSEKQNRLLEEMH